MKHSALSLRTFIKPSIRKWVGAMGFAAFATTMLILTPAPAYAACSGPTGAAGDIMMNTTHNVPQYCDDTNWIAMSGGEDPTASTSTLTDGLISYWAFEDGTGSSTVTDSVGSNDGSLTNMDAATDWITGQIGGGLDFDGSNDYVTVPNDPSLDFGSTQDFSISFWFFTRDNTAYDDLLGKNGTYGFICNYSFGISSVECYLNGDSSTVVTYAASNATALEDTWYHVTWTVDRDGNAQLYIDGAASGSAVDVSGAGNINSGTNLWFGDVDFIFLNGGLDDVRIYNRVLTAAEATELYDCGIAGDCPGGPVSPQATQVVPSGLVGHWRLDEVAGSTVATDSSGNGNDGTYDTMADASFELPGVIGTAITVENNEHIEIPHSGSIGNLSQYSISVWAHASNAGNNRLFEKDGEFSMTSQPATDWLRFNATGWDTAGNWRTDDGVVADNEWSHIVVTYDNSNTANDPILYVNGEVIPWNDLDTNPTGSLTPSTADLYIGNSSGNNEWSSPIDDFRIYNRILTPAEVRTLYAAKDGIRYNGDHRTMEYFDGNQWVSMTPDWPEVDLGPVYGYRDATAMGCPTIGDQCVDGTYYAGISQDGNTLEMFAAPSDEAGNISWGPQGNLTGITSGTDGDGNTTALAALALAHPAARTCENKTTNGYTDWYLAATNEMSLLYNGGSPIGGVLADGTEYWSSTEYDNNSAKSRRFDTGVTSNIGKSPLRVRCVRKGPAPYITGTDGLVGHWKFDETEGTTAYDSTSNGNDGTLNGSMDAEVDTTNGAVGTALSFDGVDDYINTPSSPDYAIVDFSISTWIYLSATPSETYSTIFEYARLAPGWKGLWVRDDDEIEFRWDQNSSDYNINTSSSPIQLNRWYHIVGTLNSASTTAKLYIDGVEVGSTTTATLPTAATSYFRFGLNHDDTEIFPGNIDDFRIYDRAISPDEITKLYQMGAPVGSSTALPAGCPTIGDVCDDGTIYAGLSPDGNVAMFTTAENQGDHPYNNGTNSDYVLTSQNDALSGETNTNALVTLDSDSATAGFQPHRAAQVCYDLIAHGADDWYLPAWNYSDAHELALALDAVAASPFDGPESGFYYSSTEFTQTNAQGLYADNTGATGTGQNLKYIARKIQCVRKGEAPRCANPYGVEGTLLYNTDFDVMQYCDGARWIAIGKAE